MSIWAKIFRRSPKGLNRYRILEEIEVGGMSTVYKAVDAEKGSVVALKILKPDSQVRLKQIQKIFETESEGEIGLLLNHPHIVKTFECGQDKDKYFVSMEYIEGPNLKEMIMSGDELVRANRMKIILQIGDALNYIHDKNFVHRDLCPKNVLVQSPLHTKMIDFGVTIREGQREAVDRSGTPSYMAPEQIRRQQVDKRADIYSFGISMFEILTGKFPFPGVEKDMKRGELGAMNRMQRHLNMEPSPPSEVDPTIPQALDAVVLKALNKDKNKRYQTTRELLRDLRPLTSCLRTRSAEVS